MPRTAGNRTSRRAFWKATALPASAANPGRGRQWRACTIDRIRNATEMNLERAAWKAAALPLSYTRLRLCSGMQWWRELDLNQRRHSQRIYSPSPLTTRASLHDCVRKERPSAASQKLSHPPHATRLMEPALPAVNTLSGIIAPGFHGASRRVPCGPAMHVVFVAPQSEYERET